jgi:hypothetical protein
VQAAADREAAKGSHASSVIVGEPQTLVVELPLQGAVLLAQVLDDLVLLALEPADERRDQQVQRNHCASLRQLLGEVFGHYG